MPARPVGGECCPIIGFTCACVGASAEWAFGSSTCNRRGVALSCLRLKGGARHCTRVLSYRLP
eukprot:1170320-Alexandrium_andersonii.AAC.1